MTDTAVWKTRLESERQRLTEELHRMDLQVAEDGDMLDAERGGVSNHMADDATETFEQEKMLSLRRNSERILEQVEYALKKVDDGSYGTCESCGKPIAEGRLEARPFATLCIECQSREESRHS